MYLMHYVVGVVICLMLLVILIAYMNGADVPKGLVIPAILLLILHGIANVALTWWQWKAVAVERAVSTASTAVVSAITIGGASQAKSSTKKTNPWSALGDKFSKATSGLKEKAQGSLENMANQLDAKTQGLQAQVAETAGKIIDDVSQQAERSLETLESKGSKRLDNLAAQAESRVDAISQVDEKTKDAVDAVDKASDNVGGMGAFE